MGPRNAKNLTLAILGGTLGAQGCEKGGPKKGAKIDRQSQLLKAKTHVGATWGGS